MRRKSLGINALLNSLQSLLNLVFPLITFPYISRTLSVDGIGKYNFASSIVSYFLLIATLGISTYAVREGAKLRSNRKEFSKFASNVFTLNLMSMLFSYLLLFITMLVVSSLHKYDLAILIFSIQIFFTTIGTEWVYIIFEEYGYITSRNIVFKIFSIIMLFIFVKEPNDYLNYVMITVFASTGSYILNFFHTKKFCDLKINFSFNWKEYLIPILTIFASTIAVKVYASSDTTILGFLKGDYAVGIYSVATKIYTMVGALWSAIVSVTIPRLAMLMGTNRMREYYNTLKRLTNTSITLIMPVLLGVVMLSKEVIVIIAGKNYLRAVTSLRILSFALIFSTLSGIFVNCVLIPAKREKYSMIDSFVAAFINIGLNFILIPLFSENGAALTTVIAEIIAAFLNFYFGRDIIIKTFRRNSDGMLRELSSVIIGSILVVVVCLCGKLLISSTLLRIIFDVVIALVIYGAVLIFFKNSVAVMFMNSIKESQDN